MSLVRTVSIASVVALFAGYALGESGHGAVSLKEEGNHVAVAIDGKAFTDYWFGKREDRPNQ
jgi:hypothetical protein